VREELTHSDRLRLANAAAQDAISEFAKGPLVLVALRDKSGEPIAHGSGTLVRLRNGCAVLTCAYVVDLGSTLTIVSTAGTFVDNALGAPIRHPRHVDIAIAPILDPSPFMEFAISLDQIGARSDFPLPMDQSLLVVGFPEHLSKHTPEAVNEFETPTRISLVS